MCKSQKKNRKKTLKYKLFHFSLFSGDTQGWPALCGLQRFSSDTSDISSGSFISLPQLIIKAPSHFHCSFLFSKISSFGFCLSLSEFAADWHEGDGSVLSKWKGFISVWCFWSGFPHPFTIHNLLLLLSMSFYFAWGLAQGAFIFFFFHIPAVQESLAK